MKIMASSNGITSPRPTSGQVSARLAACIFNINSPVIENTRQATENTSMNQLQAVPV